MKGWPTTTRSGRAQPAWRRLGRSPEVEEAMIASAGAARLAQARRGRFTSSHSGTLSWTKAAPSTASSTLATTSIRPGGTGGARVSRA